MVAPKFIVACLLAGTLLITSNGFGATAGLTPASVREIEAAARRVGEPRVRLVRDGRTYTVEVAGVVEGISAASLFATATSFERYASYGLPNLRASQQLGGVKLSRASSSEKGWRVTTWSWLEGFGFDSRHCYRVQVIPDLGDAHASGTEWEQVSCPGSTWEALSPGLRERIEPDEVDEPEFEWQRGSWLIQPVASDRVFVRYRFEGELRDRLGLRLMAGTIGENIEDCAREVVEVIVERARSKA